MATATPPAIPRSLARPAIFGGFDGMASLIGVIVYLLVSHPQAIFPAALSGALSSALSMGGGEYLSDSDNGLGASAVMAAATFTGALAPAVPFAFAHGTAAVLACAAVCAVVVTAVGIMRPGRTRRDIAETAALFILCAGVSLGCALVLPGSAA